MDIFMETSVLLRHQIIKNLITQSTEETADAAINLLEKMAIQIISIIGEGGFNSLYVRSVFLAQTKFPWILGGSPPSVTDCRFAGLKLSLASQVPAIASEASYLLLITFTDILATLIGEHLTASIFRSVWGDDASNKLDKELINV